MQSFAMRDTHKFATKLQKGGFSAQQVEALTEAMQDIDASDFTTKADLQKLEHAIDKRVDALKFDLIKWMVGTQLAYGAIVITVLIALR